MRIIDNTLCGWRETCRGLRKKRLVCGLYVVLSCKVILDNLGFFVPNRIPSTGFQISRALSGLQILELGVLDICRAEFMIP